MRGYFGIGIIHGKNDLNLGTLWRSANIFGASFIFTIGKCYAKRGQPTDTLKTDRHVPLYEYDSFNDFVIPRNCELISIELSDKSKSIVQFKHPQRAIYMLGAEDTGIPEYILEKSKVIQLPGDRCLNVSVAGSIVMYDRISKL